MASRDEARQAILDRIAADAPSYNADHLVKLAEAYAWLTQPNNSHGGSSAPSD